MAFRSITVVSTPAHPLVVTPPSGIADGDLLIAWAFSDSTNALGITAGGVTRTAGAFVVGATYTIVSVGTTNFVAIGASANTIGVTFVATGVGSGTGTATGGFTSFTGLEVVLSSATSDGGSFWAGWAEAASESGNYSIVNANGIVMNGGVLCMTGKAATAFINQQILATQQTSQASPWTMTAGNYAAPTDATCDEVMIGFSDNGPPGGAVSHTTPSGSGWNMRAGATGMSDGAFVNGFVATRDGVAAGATGGNSSVGTLAATSAGWSVLLVAIKQASGGGPAATTSQPYRQPVPMRPGPNGLTRGRPFQFSTSAPSSSALALPGVGALTLTGFAPTASATNNQQALPGVGALTLTGLAPTAATSGNQAVTPGVGVLTLTGLAPTATASNNQSVVPGVGVLTLSGFAPTASVTLSAVDTPRPYQMNIPMRPTGGGLVIGTPFRFATQPPAGAATASPGVGALVLTGLAPTVSASGNQTALPGVGVLTLAGLAPTVTASGNQTALPGVGVLTLTGFAPTASSSGNQNVLPGVGALTLTGLAPTVTATGNQTAAPGTGLLVLAGLAPVVVASDRKVVLPAVGALVIAGLAPFVHGTAHLGSRPLSVVRRNGTNGTGNVTVRRNPST